MWEVQYVIISILTLMGWCHMLQTMRLNSMILKKITNIGRRSPESHENHRKTKNKKEGVKKRTPPHRSTLIINQVIKRDTGNVGQVRGDKGQNTR